MENQIKEEKYMKLIKIAEAQDMVGRVLPRVEGVLVALYDQKTGEKNGKPWAMQNGMIKDDTGEMKVVFSAHDAIPLLMKGQRIQLEAFTSKQHGLVGIKVKENTWKEKTTKEIWVTGTAKILFPDVWDGLHHDTDSDQVSPSDELKEGPPGLSGPIGKSGPVGQAGMPTKPAVYINPDQQALNRVAQLGHLYDICYREAVAFTTKAKIEGLEDTRQISTAFFIQAVREGLDRGLTFTAEKVKKDDSDSDIPY